MTATPRTPKGIRTRASILEAARRVFARDGFVAARMTDVAEEAGLSLGGLYRYFGNKEDLFAAVIADVHEGLFEASTAHERDLVLSPMEALREANRGYLTHYWDNRDVMRAFMEAAHVDPRFRDIWWTMRSRHVERFVHVMQDHPDLAQGEGAVDLRLATEAMACLVEQGAYVWFAQEELHDGSVSVDEATDIVTRAWFRTLF